MSSKLLLQAESWLGKLATRLGFPGIVQDVDYRSQAFGTEVSVKRGSLFTVVSVNGVDVYFNRFSGKIDGVGFSRASGYRPDRVQESVRSAARLAEHLAQARSRMP